MKQKRFYFFCFVFLAFIFFGSTKAYSSPKLFVEKNSIDLGNIEEGKNFEYGVEIKNTGDEPLQIEATTPSCDCATILEPENGITLAPEEKTKIRFNFNSTGIEGAFTKYIFIYSNDPQDPIQKIYIKGEASVITDNIIKRVKQYGMFLVVVSGLIDGINPCAFTVLVFFVSFLTFSGYGRRQIAKTGLTFIFAVFLTYFFIGLGIFKIIQGLEIFRYISNAIRLTTGGIAILLSIISLYDFVIYKVTKDPERMKLKLPQVVKRQIHEVIRNRTDIRTKNKVSNSKVIVGAFVTGFIVSLLESICTGQTYLPTIMFMLRIPDLKVRALFNLVVYNLMFIMPLLFILVFGIMGVTSQGFAKIAQRNLGAVKLCIAFVFFVLGVSLFIIK